MPYDRSVTKTSPRSSGIATRAAIEEAARHLFTERGFEGTSVRAIGAEAGVDAALVVRYFGSKEALFLRSTDTAGNLAAVFDGPIETLGRRLVGYFLERSDSGLGQRHVALVQAAHRPQVRDELVRVTAEGFIAPLAPRLTGENRELRVALLVAQVGGLLSMLFLQENPIVVAAPSQDVIALYGDAIQALLTP